MTTRLEAAHRDALSLCAYCPSLCRHACPVAVAEARDSVTPWGLMSLAHHVSRGRLRLTEEVAEAFYHCTGCGACTDACLHQNPVSQVLTAMRAEAVGRGRQPFDKTSFQPQAEPTLGGDRDVDDVSLSHGAVPSVVLLYGHGPTPAAEEAGRQLLTLCERFGETELSVVDASGLDVGAGLWKAGFTSAFREVATRVHRALASARHVVLLSAEALDVLRRAYPAVGLTIDAQLLHVSDFLLPFLYGEGIDRVSGTVALLRACHLRDTPGSVDIAAEIMTRLAENPTIDLKRTMSALGCCGAGGCLPTILPHAARAMADAVVDAARSQGVDRIVAFAPECRTALQSAAGDALRIDDVISVALEATRGAHAG